MCECKQVSNEMFGDGNKHDYEHKLPHDWQ